LKEKYQTYLPENAISLVQDLFEHYDFILKIVNNRTTKHGDFRRLPNRKYQITINNNLHKYQFLLTLIHEIAHLATHQQHGTVKPHGKEWKKHFQHLMLPFLHPKIFPNEILPYLASYLKNPKASTGSDVQLSIALKQYNTMLGKSFIFEIKEGGIFNYKNRTFTKGSKRRTRYSCTELKSKKIYLFSAHAEVEII